MHFATIQLWWFCDIVWIWTPFVASIRWYDSIRWKIKLSQWVNQWMMMMIIGRAHHTRDSTRMWPVIFHFHFVVRSNLFKCAHRNLAYLRMTCLMMYISCIEQKSLLLPVPNGSTTFMHSFCWHTKLTNTHAIAYGCAAADDWSQIKFSCGMLLRCETVTISIEFVEGLVICTPLQIVKSIRCSIT